MYKKSYYNKNLLFRVLLLILIFFTSACSAKYKYEVNFDAAEPIRVAVLPFIQVDSNNKVAEPNPDLLIDSIELLSSHLKDTPSMFIRSLVQNELSRSGLDLISATLIDANLSHNGFDDMKSNPQLNLEKISKADPKELCEKLFSCDAIMYGTIQKWDRSYYAVQSVASIKIDLKLISAKDGKILFTSTAEDADSRGLTKGPTGFSNILIEPIKGLDNEILTNLARKVVVKMLAPLKSENRPEFLNSAPPAIFASAHDSSSGTLERENPLTVVALGSSKNYASFSIGNIIENIPMVEKDAGHYIGKYFPLSSDRFSEQPIYVLLTDDFGRTTKHEVGSGHLTLQ